METRTPETSTLPLPAPLPIWREIRQLEVETEIRFPADMDFAAIGGLSAEMQERLEAARPESFSAAQRVKGVTPSALMAVLAYLRKGKTHARTV